MKHTLFRHTAAFILSVAVAVGFLLAGACLPQAPIDANVQASAVVMEPEGSYPVMADRSFASMLDVTTDALILLESQSTFIDDWQTIFTNPLYYVEDNPASQAPVLFGHSTQPQGVVGKYYVQYWMGFRPVMRLLLSFLDYYQILRYTAVVFFVLLAAVLCDVANRLGTRTAFLFALSIIAVRPHVIAVSLQFTCCFFITFLAMLLAPRVKPRWESLFFLELGILTQYFDFYTTPVMTFCLPMIYLYLLRAKEGQTGSLKQLGGNALSWSAGYVLMWVAKLVLTSLLTSADGLGTGISAFFGRIGIEKVPELESYYNPITALRTVAVSLYSDYDGLAILFVLAAVIALWLLVKFIRDRHSLRDLLVHPQLVILAALPVIWFMVAAQPTANHHWFQYRGIAASFFAGFAWLELVMQKPGKAK